MSTGIGEQYLHLDLKTAEDEAEFLASSRSWSLSPDEIRQVVPNTTFIDWPARGVYLMSEHSSSTAKLSSENDGGSANHIDSAFGSTSHTVEMISDSLRESEERSMAPNHIVDPPQGEMALTTSHTSNDLTNQKNRMGR